MLQDNDGGIRAKAAILVDEGDVTWLEGDAAKMGLETVLLKVSTAIAQLADSDEGAGLDVVSLTHAPSALVA